MPSDTKLLDAGGSPLNMALVSNTAPARIQLPSVYNSIGLIDGQHRVFSYYEGGSSEAEIRTLRKQQNLLVTGIVYPPSISATDKTKFEAKLFLEINSTQTNARSDLKQAIELLLRPFSAEAIAKEVINRINDNGPLENQFERYFFEKGKVKTTSVVSYGIRPLVKLHGDDTLFKIWPREGKEALLAESNTDLLSEYVSYCVTQINTFVGAIKLCLPSDRWTTDKNITGRMLTTTNVNGLIVCLRRLVENQKVQNFEHYKKNLAEVDKFNFSKYRSSQYGRMGDELYKKYFA